MKTNKSCTCDTATSQLRQIIADHLAEQLQKEDDNDEVLNVNKYNVREYLQNDCEIIIKVPNAGYEFREKGNLWRIMDSAKAQLEGKFGKEEVERDDWSRVTINGTHHITTWFS